MFPGDVSKVLILKRPFITSCFNVLLIL